MTHAPGAPVLHITNPTSVILTTLFILRFFFFFLPAAVPLGPPRRDCCNTPPPKLPHGRDVPSSATGEPHEPTQAMCCKEALTCGPLNATPCLISPSLPTLSSDWHAFVLNVLVSQHQECPHGEGCLYSRNTFECWLHPFRWVGVWDR